jgi:hypothetical protein
MFASRRSFKVRDEVIRTPLLVPSYSSRAGGEAVTKIIRVTSEFVRAPILVSAYDVKRHKVRQSKLDFATLIFLDSGGYEAGGDADLSEVVTTAKHRNRWLIKDYEEVIDSWDFRQPTIVVNYDSPDRREPLAKQIDRARRSKDRIGSDASHIFLAKPEPKRLRSDRHYVDVDRLISKLPQLSQFDVIGLTEKEFGESLLTRLLNVAKLRRALSESGSAKPIHIFGSLDPVACPLFFIAGADIFDGLTWLRYSYQKGLTIYRQNVLALDEVDVGTRDGELSALIHVQNYHALGHLSDEMIRFADTKDFEALGEQGKYFKRVSERILAEMEHKHGEVAEEAADLILTFAMTYCASVISRPPMKSPRGSSLHCNQCWTRS